MPARHFRFSWSPRGGMFSTLFSCSFTDDSGCILRLPHFQIANSRRTSLLRVRGSGILLDWANAGAARLRIERVADPNDHFGFGGERKDLGVKNLRTAGGKGVGLVVTELVQETSF